MAKMPKINLSNEPISRTLLSKCGCCMILNKTIWYRDIEIFSCFDKGLFCLFLSVLLNIFSVVGALTRTDM